MGDPSRVRVFVASEVREYRAGLSRLVATEDGLELAGAGKAPECASRFRSSAQPDVVLIDVTEQGARQAVVARSGGYLASELSGD